MANDAFNLDKDGIAFLKERLQAFKDALLVEGTTTYDNAFQSMLQTVDIRLTTVESITLTGYNEAAKYIAAALPEAIRQTFIAYNV